MTVKVAPFFIVILNTGIKIALVSFCFLWSKWLTAQMASVQSAAVEAMASSGVSLRGANVLGYNPASVSESPISFGVNYSNQFLISGINQGSAYLVFPVSESRVFGSLGQFGY